MHVTGDSTSNDPIDWAFKLTDLIAARKPEFTTKYHLWNKATQRWGSWSQRTSGTAGNRYCTLGSAAAARFNAPVDFSSIVDIDVRVKMAADDWTPTATAAFIGVDAGDPNRVFWFYLLHSGKLRLYWFPLGTNASAQFVDSTAAVGFANGSANVVRATLDVDDGSGNHVVKFYTSNTNGSWTQLGSTITNAGTTNIKASASSSMGIGARGVSNGIPGDYYYVELRDSIDSVGVSAHWDASYYDGADNTFQGVNGNTWTPTGSPAAVGALGFRVHNASQSGQSSAGWSADPPFALGHPVEPQVHLLNLGHNDGAATTIVAYTALLDAIETRWPNAARGLIRQNQEPPTAANPTEHDTRQELILSLAGARHYELLDADAALQAYTGGDWTVDLMEDWAGGNVHPNAAGGTQIADVFDAQFAAPRKWKV